MDRLTNLWQHFAEAPEKRLCIWTIASEENQMMEAFYQREISEAGEIGDLFLRFEAGFPASQAYGQALVSELSAMIEADREAMGEEDLQIDWQAQPIQPGQSDQAYLLEQMASFAKSMAELDGKFVLYLMPEAMSHPQQWEEWMQNLLKHEIPEMLRFMLLTREEVGFGEDLEKIFPTKISCIAPKLEMHKALEEIASAGNPADPGVQFRKAYIALSQAASEGELSVAEVKGQEALEIAQKQQWHDMQFSVWLLLGTAYQNHGKPSHAHARFFSALNCATQVKPAPFSAKLQVQALMARASLHIHTRDWQLAQPYYQQATEKAEEAGDPFYLMETARMAALCDEKEDELDRAWIFLMKAFEAGKELDPETRPHTTFPFVGSAILRIGPKAGKAREADQIERQMPELAGEDWMNQTNLSVKSL
ncbi:MAG: hypothetical protein AAFR61_03025 [Bacteroidota bacterium]